MNVKPTTWVGVAALVIGGIILANMIQPGNAGKISGVTGGLNSLLSKSMQALFGPSASKKKQAPPPRFL